MLETLQEHLDTWLQRLCVEWITLLWLTIMLQVSLHMNQCLKETIQRKNSIRYKRVNISQASSSQKEELPLGWSENSLDFVNQLILRKPERRLGSNGIEEILHHPWLKGYPWDDLLKKKVQALYVPGAVDDNFDFQNQISEETQLNDEQQLENQTLLRRDTVQSLFEGYHYDIELKNIQHQQTQKNHSQRKSQPVSPEKA